MFNSYFDTTRGDVPWFYSNFPANHPIWIKIYGYMEVCRKLRKPSNSNSRMLWHPLNLLTGSVRWGWIQANGHSEMWWLENHLENKLNCAGKTCFPGGVSMFFWLPSCKLRVRCGFPHPLQIIFLGNRLPLAKAVGPAALWQTSGAQMCVLQNCMVHSSSLYIYSVYIDTDVCMFMYIYIWFHIEW